MCDGDRLAEPEWMDSRLTSVFFLATATAVEDLDSTVSGGRGAPPYKSSKLVIFLFLFIIFYRGDQKFIDAKTQHQNSGTF